MKEGLEIDKQLVEELRSGDQRAFTAIYKAYWYDMYLVVFRKLNNHEAAEEIVQDIFTRLWKEHKTLTITHLDRYLFSAVRYEVIDYLRSKVNSTIYDDYFRELDHYMDTETENTIIFNDLQATIHRGLDELPVKSKEIFISNWFHYLSIKEIAKQYRLSEKAVQYHLAKALKHIRLHLSDHAMTLISALFYYL